MYICKCIYVYIYTHTYTYIYTHIYIISGELRWRASHLYVKHVEALSVVCKLALKEGRVHKQKGRAEGGYHYYSGVWSHCLRATVAPSIFVRNTLRRFFFVGNPNPAATNDPLRVNSLGAGT